MTDALTLTPLTGTALLMVAVFAGRAFRQTWKAQGPRWRLKAWVYGTAAALALLTLAFIPLKT